MGMGERIRKLRTEKGLSQEALAMALGISRQAVAKWEGEQSAPSAANLTAMAALVEVPVTAITAPEPGEAPEEPPAPEPRPGRSGKGGGLWKAALGLGGALVLGILVRPPAQHGQYKLGECGPVPETVWQQCRE